MPRNRLLIKKEIEAYAEVLLELGESTDSVYSISAQLEEMKKVVRMHPGLRDVLANDSIDENTRATVIHEVFKEFSVDMIKFVIVMAERQDIPLLPRVAECYDQMVQDKYDVVILDVATVIPLDDELREKFKSEFAAQFGLLFDDYRFDALFCQTQGRLHARNAAAYDCHSFHYSLMSYIVSVGQQFTTADAGLPIYFPLRPRYLAAGSYSTPILSSRGSTSTWCICMPSSQGS